jgi:ATP-dependent protease ClpP protease subunit
MITILTAPAVLATLFAKGSPPARGAMVVLVSTTGKVEKMVLHGPVSESVSIADLLITQPKTVHVDVDGVVRGVIRRTSVTKGRMVNPHARDHHGPTSSGSKTQRLVVL